MHMNVKEFCYFAQNWRLPHLKNEGLEDDSFLFGAFEQPTRCEFRGVSSNTTNSGQRELVVG